MRYAIIALPAMLAMTACAGAAPETEPEAEALTEYRAMGSEPAWSVDIKDDQISFASANGPTFELPVSRMNKTDTGWEVKAFSDAQNINMTIAVDQECADAASERSYADTVQIAVGAFGNHSGCGGALMSGEAPAEDGAPAG